MKINMILPIISLILTCCAYDLSAAETSHFPQPVIFKFDKPITAAEARQKLRFPLPEEAAKILFAEYSQFIAQETYLRFEAPLDICKTHTMTLLNEFKYEDQVIILKPITEALEKIRPPKELGNIRWFEKIRDSALISAPTISSILMKPDFPLGFFIFLH